jgi:hypothetical protein
MKRAARRDDDGRGIRRLALGEMDRRGDMRFAIAGVEDAGRFVGEQRALGRAAFGGHITLGDGPELTSDVIRDGPLGIGRGAGGARHAPEAQIANRPKGSTITSETGGNAL